MASMFRDLSSAFAALLACLSVAAIGLGLWHLNAAAAGVTVTRESIGDAPATIFRPASGVVGPVVVIAHGFAGSQQLMQSFALTFARNGYVAVTFDFPGHGRNSVPLTGSISDANGATRVLVDSLAKIAVRARQLGDGRLAVLGHSMASDIVVRYGESAPGVTATIAVSMFSPAVTATAPANLLIITGDWESMLKREALRAVGLATTGSAARAGVTYGEPAYGTGRRAAFSPHVEHVSVLYSSASLREAVRWLDASFSIVRPPAALALADRGAWLLLLIGGVVLLAKPLSMLLPRVATPPVGAGRGWRALRIPILLPMVATPLLLRVLPTHFLPVLVGDYLAAHFALYGLLTMLCLWFTQRGHPTAPHGPVPVGVFAAATLCVVTYGFLGLVWPIDSYFTSFVPGSGRALLILAMLAGTLLFFLSDEWLTRGPGAARGAYAASKMAFVISLAIAVALDPYRLFFLIIIVPVIVLCLLIYGLMSAWVYRRTGYPYVAGIANAVAFAWAIGVTFPLVSG